MKALLIAIFIVSEIAFGGNWSSGGGEILEHAQNPWFLTGSKGINKVGYCVAKGADFPIALDQLEILVATSIKWWNGQFSNAYYPDNKVVLGGKQTNLKVFVNTSSFVKEECSESTDLAFQFGYLTNAQVAEFQKHNIDLTRYVALTIRTDYSEMLRGRGFIYVSPDRGPNAFKGQNIQKEAWTNNDPYSTRLQTVINHELGHVFGLAHAGSNDSIMSARLAEIMVSDSSMGNRTVYSSAMNGSVFFPKSGEIDYSQCGAQEKNKKFRDYFEIPSELDCFSVSYNLNALTIRTRKSNSDPWQFLGAARFNDGGRRRHQQLVTLWLPQNQQFFPGLPAFFSSLLGPASSEVQQTGEFMFKGSNKAKPVFVQASSRYVQIGGVLNNGVIDPDLLPESTYGRSISGWEEN